MNKETLAGILNGREYLSEITDLECDQAKASGLLVIYGYSDDNVELRGAVYDELSAADGAEFLLRREDPILMPPHDKDCECPYCGYAKAVEYYAVVTAIFDGGTGYSWTFKTEAPHAAFDILEDGEKYCRGIVIDVNDLPSIK